MLASPIPTPPPTIKPLSGEAIRLMNYIDDVAVTLRRVLATVPTLSAEERARVAEHLLRPAQRRGRGPGPDRQVSSL
jgi:hypothetical protein